MSHRQGRVDADRDAVRTVRIQHVDVLHAASGQTVVKPVIQRAHRDLRQVEDLLDGARCAAPLHFPYVQLLRHRVRTACAFFTSGSLASERNSDAMAT